MTELSLAKLSPNQRRVLSYIRPGLWFYPDENSDLVYIHSRYNSCRILAEKGFLVQRPVNRYGSIDFEFILTVETATKLGIIHEELPKPESE